VPGLVSAVGWRTWSYIDGRLKVDTASISHLIGTVGMYWIIVAVSALFCAIVVVHWCLQLLKASVHTMDFDAYEEFALRGVVCQDIGHLQRWALARERASFLLGVVIPMVFLWTTLEISRSRYLGASSSSARVGIEPRSFEAANWQDFEDGGGRFRCRIPTGSAVDQVESGSRSKVILRVGDANISIIVRPTGEKEVTIEAARTLSHSIEQSFSSYVETDSHLGECDGVKSIYLTGRVDNWLSSIGVRGVKFVKHAQDHSITLGAPDRSFQAAIMLFDRFLSTYHSVEPTARTIGP